MMQQSTKKCECVTEKSASWREEGVHYSLFKLPIMHKGGERL